MFVLLRNHDCSAFVWKVWCCPARMIGKYIFSHFKIYPAQDRLLQDIDLIANINGFGVPLFNYAGEGDLFIFEWAEKKEGGTS